MKLLCKLLFLDLGLRNELMERWVEKTEGDRLAVHNLQCTFDSSLDVWLKLGKSSLSFIVALCKNHLAEF